jgi:MoxR-like ATPase
LQQVVDGHELAELSRLIWDVHVDDTVRDYIVRLVAATRSHPDLLIGASPRGSLALYRGAQAYAALQHRDYVLPDDVKRLASIVLAHRCLAHPESALRGVRVATVIERLINETELRIGEL